MKGQRIVLLVLCCALLHSTASGQRDRTQELEASGTDVVLATIARLNQAKIFSDDNRLLRRVAHVESRDGNDADTFRTGYNGGIWQVDEQNFLKTQDRITFPFLAQPGGIFELLLSTLNIDWTAARWVDLRKPLISALAARIFFEIAEMDIPAIGDVQGQGEFWKSSGFNNNSEDTVERFVADVTALEVEEISATMETTLTTIHPQSTPPEAASTSVYPQSTALLSRSHEMSSRLSLIISCIIIILCGSN